jgi:Domain of unknown function (DUF5011)
MKNIKYLIQLLVLGSIILATSCKKDSENISKTTYYPVFTYNGDHFISIPIGGTFTDPGVTAILDGKDWPVTKTGSVDISTPGVYRISYSSINPDSFSISDYRYIGIIDPGAAAKDLTGKYFRASNGDSAFVTKIAPGLYLDSNVGGSPGFEIPVFFFQTTDSTIEVPLQTTLAGSLQCANAELTATGFQWVVINGNFGTSTRVFVKQ